MSLLLPDTSGNAVRRRVAADLRRQADATAALAERLYAIADSLIFGLAPLASSPHSSPPEALSPASGERIDTVQPAEGAPPIGLPGALAEGAAPAPVAPPDDS